MTISLGVDFGTSYTKIAYRDGDNPPQPLDISYPRGKDYMPSVAAYKRSAKGGVVLAVVGEGAENYRRNKDYILIEDIKRFLEVSYTEEPLADFKYEKYPWWDSKQNSIVLWGNKIAIKDVITEILKEALRRAANYAVDSGLIKPPVPPKISLWRKIWDFITGKHAPKQELEVDISGCQTIFGCSVTAGLEIRKIMYSIAEELGFRCAKVKTIQEEPILASLPYLLRELKTGDILLVYDFGGGTFDTAVIKIDEANRNTSSTITVLSAGGIPFCGGVDIDNAIASHIKKQVANFHFLGKIPQIIDPNNDLLKISREMKEELSTHDRTDYTLDPGIYGQPGISVSMTRQELEEVIIDSRLVDKTLQCMLGAWRSARSVMRRPSEAAEPFHLGFDAGTRTLLNPISYLSYDDLQQFKPTILLVGGTTKIPCVSETLRNKLQQVRFINEADPIAPIMACAIGGAIQKVYDGTIIGRFPFSIFINDIELYQAFTVIAELKTQTDNPRIQPYTSKKCVNVESGPAVVRYVTPDGDTIGNDTIQIASSGEYELEINCYGVMHLKYRHLSNIEIIIPTFGQHEIQLAQWNKILKAQRDKNEQDAASFLAKLKQKPGTDHNTDVG